MVSKWTTAQNLQESSVAPSAFCFWSPKVPWDYCDQGQHSQSPAGDREHLLGIVIRVTPPRARAGTSPEPSDLITVRRWTRPRWPHLSSPAPCLPSLETGSLDGLLGAGGGTALEFGGGQSETTVDKHRERAPAAAGIEPSVSYCAVFSRGHALGDPGFCLQPHQCLRQGGLRRPLPRSPPCQPSCFFVPGAPFRCPHLAASSPVIVHFGPRYVISGRCGLEAGDG